MLSDFLERMKTALAPEIDGHGGIFLLATDRNEALTLAIKNMSAKWLCLLFLTGGNGGEYNLSINGYLETDYTVAICRRPVLTRDRSAKALSDDDEASLAKLWDTVRGLVYRVRFGTLTAGEDENAGKVFFAPREGYLDGDKPMQVLKFSIERQFYEVAEPGNTTKGMKELLWAETQWRVKLALPARAVDDNRLDKFFLCC